MAQLEIEIGADKKEFDLKIKEVESDIKQLSQVKLDRIKLGLDTKEITGNIRDAKKSLGDLKTSLKDTGQSFTAMQKPVQNGGNTLMQFSRIAQDAPFGIMGIGNNITATAESFSYLSKSSGGAGNALKAVASSMLGTGGILLAVSLVTSALTYMSQNGITVGDVFNKLTGRFDEFAQSVSKAGAEAAKNASEQISNANAYVSAAKNINISMSDRLLAVKKLQSEYPAYFGNLSKEQILNGDVASAVKGVTDALIAKAKAAAFSGQIAKLAEEEFKLREKEALQIKQVEKAQIKVNALLKDKSKLASEAGANIGSAFVSEKQALRDIQDEIKANQVLQGKYTNEINKSTAAQIKLLAVTEKQGKAVKAQSSKPMNVTPQVGGLQSDLQPAGLNTLQGGGQIIKTQLEEIRNQVASETVAMEVLLNQFNTNSSDIINSGISNTFANLGAVIGQGLATGGNVLKAAGSVLLSSLGGILVDLGKMAIQVGVGLLGIKTALKTLNPALAIAGGVALIAIGSLFSSQASALGGSSGSGGGGSSFSTGANVSSPNTSNFSSSSSNGGTVVFEISGQSLIGVLSNTLDRNSRLGGSLGLAN